LAPAGLSIVLTAALHYQSDAFDTSRPKLMGRHAAGEGFLRGLARHGSAETLFCHSRTEPEFADFEARVAALAGRPRACSWIPFGDHAGLVRAGCLHYPAPGIGELAWQRRFGPARSYSLTGVTHTTASGSVMDGIGNLLLAPLQSWDALICTSTAVKATIEAVHAGWGAYLADKTGGTPVCAAQLPVIPLGVECDEFADSKQAAKTRASLRKKLGADAGDIVVLFVGRLSYHAKAHPLPMYLGLEEAAKRSGKRIHLVQAGWFANEALREHFIEAAKSFCPSVNCVFLDGRDPKFRMPVWFAADVFASLSDNIQETFGLTPIEAMAAGLPVVASDWDGYRDTVRHGEDGYLIPTFMPPPGTGEGLARRQLLEMDSYDRYIGYTSQCIGVDVRAAAEAFTALASDSDLRRRMGEAGRARARSQFDWRVIVEAYEALWEDLAARRAKDAEVAARRPGMPVHPLRGDPFAVFAGYPSLTIGPKTVVTAATGASEGELQRLAAASMNNYALELILPLPRLAKLLEQIMSDSPVAAEKLLAGVPESERTRVLRALGWLGKMGLVGFAAPPA